MAQKSLKEDDDAYSMHPCDGNFQIKPAPIAIKKRKKKKKSNVENELHNTRMDLIQ